MFFISEITSVIFLLSKTKNENQNMKNCEWSKINEACRENEQFLNKAWFEAWKIQKENIESWQGDIKYEPVDGSYDNHAIIAYGIQAVGPFYFASLAGSYFPQRGIPNTGPDPELIKNIADKIFEIVKSEGFRTSGFRMDYVHREDEFITNLKAQLLKNNWKLISRQRDQNFGMNFWSSEEEFMASLNSKKKSKIRSRKRNMAKIGNVKLKHYNDLSQDEWAKIFKEVEVVESNAWIGEKDHAKFVGSVNQIYWNSLVEDAWFRRAMNVWIMYLNDKPVSYSLEMDTEDTRYSMCRSYDKDVAKYGTGIAIVIAIIVQAIESGKKYYDLGLGDTGYKADIGAAIISTLDEYIFFPPTFMGRFSYYMAKAKKFMDKVKNLLPR